MTLDLVHLRAVAEAVPARRWEWSGRGANGYPQQVIGQGDASLVAECYESPDHPSAFAEFIATFDPPTVLALLEMATDSQSD